MHRERNFNPNPPINPPVLVDLLRYYKKGYTSNPNGYVVIPENEVEEVIFSRLYQKGKLDSHLQSAREAGMVAELYPGGVIFFRNKRFGWKKINADDFDFKISMEYFALKSEMENT